MTTARVFGTLHELGGFPPTITLDLGRGAQARLPCSEADCRALGGALGSTVTISVTAAGPADMPTIEAGQTWVAGDEVRATKLTAWLFDVGRGRLRR